MEKVKAVTDERIQRVTMPKWGLSMEAGKVTDWVHATWAGGGLLVALLGTTITPFMQLFQQSSTVERGVARRHYGPERVDAYVGAVFSNLISITMIIATAATLFQAGRTEIASAADAARAKGPAHDPANGFDRPY